MSILIKLSFTKVILYKENVVQYKTKLMQYKINARSIPLLNIFKKRIKLNVRNTRNQIPSV